ncbi:MAG: hypothetical protein HKN63_09135 [Rhodobacteraceae bacterium]|nr:hypothetical protein [Paracoccaceae bacterium]
MIPAGLDSTRNEVGARGVGAKAMAAKLGRCEALCNEWRVFRQNVDFFLRHRDGGKQRKKEYQIYQVFKQTPHPYGPLHPSAQNLTRRPANPGPSFPHWPPQT